MISALPACSRSRKSTSTPHFKDRCWNDYLTVGSKKVSKRYLADDLARS